VDLTIKADLEDPSVVKAIFDKVKAKLGVPNVVVYNGMPHSIPYFCHK
jgi:hypothetical protein